MNGLQRIVFPLTLMAFGAFFLPSAASTQCVECIANKCDDAISPIAFQHCGSVGSLCHAWEDCPGEQDEDVLLDGTLALGARLDAAARGSVSTEILVDGRSELERGCNGQILERRYTAERLFALKEQSRVIDL